jgi:1-acyl-sn-glycerol-3-phosphate acyltransferase
MRQLAARVAVKARVIPFPLRRQANAGLASSGSDQPASQTSSVFRQIRATWRLIIVAQHLLWGCAVVAGTFRFRSPESQRRAKRIWSHQLLSRLGVELRAFGEVPQRGGVLIAANHISWIDIFVINALRPCAFVCKEEIRAWPLIGWLVANTETVFIERGNRRAARRTAETLKHRLAGDSAIVVFPEGTTTNGTHLLPFRPAMMQAAVDAEVPVVPVALRYRDPQHPISPAPAYDGDISLWECLRAIALADGLVAETHVLEAIDTRRERQHIAAHAHSEIATRLGFIETCIEEAEVEELPADSAAA